MHISLIELAIVFRAIPPFVIVIESSLNQYSPAIRASGGIQPEFPEKHL
jgi:hypothetical protein